MKIKKTNSERKGDRVLKNKRIISALPSGGKAGSDISIDGVVDAMKNFK